MIRRMRYGLGVIALCIVTHMCPMEIQYGWYGSQGQRNYMEDMVTTATDVLNIGDFLAIICDGHTGKDVAEYATKQLPIILMHSDGQAATVEQKFAHAFELLDKQIQEKELAGGSTIVCAYIYGKKGYFVWAGDSRGLLVRGKKIVLKTADHNLKIPTEDDRVILAIKKANGVDERKERRSGRSKALLNTSYYELVAKRGGIYEDTSGCWRINGINMTRVLGDHDMKAKTPGAIIGEPAVLSKELFFNDTIILHSDGVNEGSKQADLIGYCNQNDLCSPIIKRVLPGALQGKKYTPLDKSPEKKGTTEGYNNPKVAELAKKIVTESLKNSTDNVTALVIRIVQGKERALKKHTSGS